MGKGNRPGGGRPGGGEGLDPADIVSTSNMLVSNKVGKKTYSEVSNALNDYASEYGMDTRNTREAKLKGKGQSVLAFYDGKGIAFNSTYLDSDKMNTAMDNCASTGYHPPRGNKSGLEAVASHELGHQLTDMVADKLGMTGAYKLDKAADKIVNEARKLTKHKGVVIMAKAISTYAATTNAEAIAEAIADCYCNGNKAKAESKAIKTVVDKYLKG